MAAGKTPEVSDPKISKLMKVYMRMKARRDEIAKAHKEEEDTLKESMDKIKSALLDYCREHGIEGARTEHGLFFRTKKTNYWASDWAEMHKFVLEHAVPEFLEKRLNQGVVAQYLADHPDAPPPGLKIDASYQIGIRR